MGAGGLGAGGSGGDAAGGMAGAGGMPACLGAADCDDADDCTIDACNDGVCAYSFNDVPACAAGWTAASPMTSPPATFWSALAYDPIAEQVIMFGGLDANTSTMLDTMWAWDGSNWTELNPPNRPSARWTHGMVYDATLGRVVLFGGLETQFGGNALAETWEWDGATWTQAAPAQSPPARGVHGNMTFDHATGRTTIFGGGIQPGVPTFDDQWQYDGTTWSQIVTAVTPPRRVAACFAYMASAGGPILFAGGEWTDPYRSDTWRLSGGVFTLLDPAQDPGPRQSAVCAYDPWRDKLVLHGGGLTQSPLTFSNEVWEFDGAAWSEVNVPGAPGAGCCGVMTYDAARRQIVYFNEAGITSLFGAP